MCNTQESLFTTMTDTLDDNSLKLRKGQAKDKFKKHANDIVNPWQAMDKETTKCLGALDELMAMDEKQAPEDNEEHDDEDTNSDDLAHNCSESDFGSASDAEAAPRSSKPAAKASKPAPSKPAAKASKSAPAPARPSAKGEAPKAVRPAENKEKPAKKSANHVESSDEDVGRGKGKGKASVIPVDPRGILERDGVYELEKQFKADFGKIGQAPFEANANLSSKEAAAAGTKIIRAVQKHLDSLVKTQKLINKRKHTPDEVHIYMKELKQSMQKALSLVNDVTQLPTFDAEKHLRVLPTIGPIKAGKYFYCKFYRVLVFDDVRLSRFSVLSGRVNVNNGLLQEHGFCPSECRDLNDDCLERSLQQCGKSVAGDKKQDAFCLLKMRTA